MGTKFTVFDNALNPERALPDMSNARQELAGIIYVSHHLIQAASDRSKNGLKNDFSISFFKSLAPGNKRVGNEGTQKNDSYHSRDEQGQ